MDCPTEPIRPSADFEATVLPLTPGLLAAARQFCRSEDDARDLVQETVMRAWRFWGSYRDDGRCAAWLRRILRNTFINRYRQRRREQDGLGRLANEVIAAERQQQPPAAGEGFGDEVEHALGRLPVDFRRVLLAVDVDDLSYREVADRLECPIGTVMSRLHRGRRLLRDDLARYGQQEGYLRAG